MHQSTRKSHCLDIVKLPSGEPPEFFPRSLLDQPYFVCLDANRGRFSMAALEPLTTIEASKPQGGQTLLATLKSSLKEGFLESPQGLELPFAGGWIGYLGYELYGALEGQVPSRLPDLLPAAFFGFYDSFYLYDHAQQCSYLIFSTSSSSRRRFLEKRWRDL